MSPRHRPRYGIVHLAGHTQYAQAAAVFNGYAEQPDLVNSMIGREINETRQAFQRGPLNCNSKVYPVTRAVLGRICGHETVKVVGDYMKVSAAANIRKKMRVRAIN
jgi:hypothetical protein